MNTINYKGIDYPELQSTGFAAQWAFPFARYYCKGVGFDIGSMKDEWSFPGSVPVDPIFTNYDAMNLPEAILINSRNFYQEIIKQTPLTEVDYIFSSHCLEHIPERIGTVLEYWLTRIRKGGVIFLYLPNMDYQHYWAFGNKKHVHYLNPAIMKGFCHELECSSYIVTEGYDLNGSFYVIIEK